MIFWKEWRETRFGFLTTLLFLCGVYYSLSANMELNPGYWVSMFLALFAMAMAITLGSGAISAEVESGAMEFIIAKPVAREKLFLAKYFIRAAEVVLVLIVPTLLMMPWDRIDNISWMMARPWLFHQYIICLTLFVLFIFSGAFLSSILFRKQSLSVFAGVGFLAVYLAFRGLAIFRTIYRLETLYKDIYLLVALVTFTFIACLFSFKRREF